MTPPTPTRRDCLRAGGLLAAATAGCAAPGAEPSSRERGGFGEAETQRAREVGTGARRAVVVLQPPGRATSGTGWFLDGGHLVTNSHVVDELGGGPLEVNTLDGERFEATVDRRADQPDLALLRADAAPPATLTPGSSAGLEAGEPLVQVGHVALGYWTVSVGRFRRRLDRDGRSWLLSDLPTMRGNSGSPVLSLDGEVVGLTFGAVKKPGTGAREDPTPGSTAVYATYPRRRVEFGGHLTIETVLDRVRRWTGGQAG